MEPKAGDHLKSKWIRGRRVHHVLGAYVLYDELGWHNQWIKSWTTLSAWKKWAETAERVS